MKKDTRTVEWVSGAGLCSGCGTCAGMCPNDAVEMIIDLRKGVYVPVLDHGRCNECGLCFDVCPGHAVDFRQLNLDIFDREPEDAALGNYLACYLGHAADYDIRYNSASGGLVTALLVFALEEGLIDGALVTGMRADRPLETQPFIARTREEIISAAKSKYCPVPANIALKEILASREGERFAVVGLPCHIQGARKAERVSKKLRSKIVLHLGIFCWHTDTFLQTDFILQKYGIHKADVTRLHYRGRGWPGSMVIESKDGMEKVIPLHQYIIWHMLCYLIPRRCDFCSDALADLTDISFGDAWLPEFRSDKVGENIAIPRSHVGGNLIRKAQARNMIEVTQTVAEKVVQTQKLGLYFKKRGLRARIHLFHSQVAVPANTMKSDIVDYAFAIYQYLSVSFLSLSPFRQRVLKHIPLVVLRLYGLPSQALPWLRMRGFRVKRQGP